jgi:hypothetical protein
MGQRYRLFRRSNGVFFVEDRITRRQESLRTKDRAVAARLFHAKNEAHQQPALNLQIARAYLMAVDPAIATRTWQHAMDEIIKTKQSQTERRWITASALNLRRVSLTRIEWMVEHAMNSPDVRPILANQ